MTRRQKRDLIAIFTNHPVAANLLMLMMLLAGAWGISQLNTQFFPNFELRYASVRVAWTGASAEDVERLITTPIEQELRNVDGLKEMTSTSTEGISAITLEFVEGTDIGLAVDQVKEFVDQVRQLPESAEIPEIQRIVRYEPVSRLLVTGSDDVNELRGLVRRFERELLERGIARIEVYGLPEEEIAIQIPSATLRDLGMSLNQIGQLVAQRSRDIPVGVIGRSDTARQLRFTDQRRTNLEFENLVIAADEGGRRITLGDVATIERRQQEGQVTGNFKGMPAVEMRMSRSETSDALDAARIMQEWLEETRPTLPPNIELHTYAAQWELIQQRINLLLKNGGGGLILIILILFFFLNSRTAWWVTVGIPVSFMATLAVLYLIGGSINMISLFGLIMALGIIVDDAIVVGEDATTHFQQGEPAHAAAEGGARRMLAPVMSSSLTTISAFLPLFLVGGIIGSILTAIPTVIVCVIIASLIESFWVLPGHLRHSFAKTGHYTPSATRQRLDRGFARFRDGPFRAVVTKAVEFRWASFALAIALFLVSLGMLMGGRLAFQFFPSAEGTTLYANVDFVSGTARDKVKDYIVHMEQKLQETAAEFGEDLIVAAVTRFGFAETEGNVGGRVGDRFGSIVVELSEPDEREVRNRDFIKAWRDKLQPASGIENVTVTEQRAGPPGRDIEIRVRGENTAAIKAASIDLKQALNGIEGVSGIEDDMPFGREQLILKMTPVGEALGLSVEEVGRQLRAAYDGFLVQILAEGDDEVEIRVVLPDAERNRAASLNQIDIFLPDGSAVPLNNVVTVRTDRGFETIRHADGKLALTIVANVDTAVANINEIVDRLTSSTLPPLRVKHGVDFSFQGRQQDQVETMADMRRGGLIALTLIYLVLAWVFGSYGWPLVVMAIIPFGLVGAIWGHIFMGLDLTILSMFGFFGLAGIVVNDSIILVVFYKHLRQKGMEVKQAVIEAACQRLRAVLLTSLTTIAGLTPLLFETSLQAQFLIPMATSIAFGIGFATILVLLLVPSLLYIHERIAHRSTSKHGEQATAV